MEKHIKLSVYEAFCSRNKYYYIKRKGIDDIELKHKHSNDSAELEIILEDYIQLVRDNKIQKKEFSAIRRVLQKCNNAFSKKIKMLEKDNKNLEAKNFSLQQSLKECKNDISTLEKRIRNICLLKKSRKGDKCKCLGINENCLNCFGTGYLID